MSEEQIKLLETPVYDGTENRNDLPPEKIALNQILQYIGRECKETRSIVLVKLLTSYCFSGDVDKALTIINERWEDVDKANVIKGLTQKICESLQEFHFPNEDNLNQAVVLQRSLWASLSMLLTKTNDVVKSAVLEQMEFQILSDREKNAFSKMLIKSFTTIPEKENQTLEFKTMAIEILKLLIKVNKDFKIDTSNK